MRRFSLPAVLALTIASCNESTAPATDLETIQVSVRADPATIVAGNAARIVVTLKNPAARSVEISDCPIYYWVQGKGGQIVGGSNAIYCAAATLVYMPLRFAPFETKTLTFSWSAADTQNVPPGTYDLFGWVNDPAHVSAPARITVLVTN
jgi:hypothetical protein